VRKGNPGLGFFFLKKGKTVLHADATFLAEVEGTLWALKDALGAAGNIRV